ncbi:MAG TPA: M23 family metallopeptidase [bacterium]|nr:M23 family metallopeptidase [bacterium]
MKRISYHVLKVGAAGLVALAILLLSRPQKPILDQEPPPPAAQVTEVSVQDTLSRGESLYASLLSKGISGSKALNLLSALGQRLNLRSCGTGDSYEASIDETGTIVSMLYHKGFKQLFRVHADSVGAGYVVSQGVVEPVGVTRRIEGKLTSCLWDAFTSIGEDPTIALKLADVFAWELDFVTDPRVGDTFTIVFDELRYPSGQVEIGDVLCARYVNDGKEHRVFRFEDEPGKPGYYDYDGSSARRVFLKSPLSYRRISSFFSGARLDPILKVYRPHYGVDYAAPMGTPVVSIGDGRVVMAGWNDGFGRYVEIRHNGMYASCYGHLSGFGDGVRSGSMVSQGQVIGYVGSTGMSTGPHLDFRIKKYGSYVNPLTLDCPRAEPVSDAHKAAFIELRDTLIKAFDYQMLASS